MKNFARILAIMLVVSTTFAFVACRMNKQEKKNSDGVDIVTGTADVVSTESTEESKEYAVSEIIKNTMAINNALSGSNYFLATDGSILVMGDSSDKGHADVYATIPNLKKVFNGSSAVFALTESGDLYYQDNVIATGINNGVYCTTNTNVAGYCLKDNDIMWIKSDETVFEHSQYSNFRDMISRETFWGKTFSIEVDKHDFFVINTNGKLFAYVTNYDQYAELDFTAFENLALADVAKHMGKGEVESLTVAGLKDDGTVVACGTYAEEIMGWGKLCDITMSDGIIVGLKEDGTLKMTGDYAEKMKETVESWKNIVAIEAGYAHGNNIGYILTAMDANGTFYYVSLTDERASIDTGYATAENGATGDRFWYKYTPDGKVFFSDNGSWEEA